MSKRVEVRLWGETVGYLGYAPGQKQFATFEYTDEFMRTGILFSPVKMKYPPRRFTFDDISFRTFKGLAGIFTDSLPDKFGNQLIDIFMAEKNIPPEEITALDRLLYVGTRGMGALEYHPAEFEDAPSLEPVALDLPLLSDLAQLVLTNKEALNKKLHDAKTREEALNLIKISSSAGGARAKALVARDAQGKFYDGTANNGKELTYWLLKFDSEENSDLDHKDPKGMTKIEYIYSLIAKKCGIDIPRVDYIQQGDDFHFLIERFDRDASSSRLQKIHYASWSGLAHADRDTTGAYSYEQLILLARQIGIKQDGITELFRRAVFNVIGRNQDDHTKNFGFLMHKNGQWRLAPAFDMTYSYDPSGKWTNVHQIKLNKKQDGFSLDDMLAFGKYCNLSEKESKNIVFQVTGAFMEFENMAKELDVNLHLLKTISNNLRTGTL